MVKTVHLVLQGKGGVGKSLTASMLAQFLKVHDYALTAIDTDPTNASFAAIEALGAKHIQIMEDGEINPRLFDSLMEEIFEAEDDAHIVVDTGATAFIALCAYLAQNQALMMLEQSDIRVFLHTPICGGAAFDDTIAGLRSILEHFPTVPVVVWANEFFGPVEKNGRTFEESKLYREHADRVVSIMRHEKVHRDTFGEDVRQMMERKLSFQQACVSPDFNVMARQRLKLIWRSIEAQLMGAPFLEDGA